MPTKNTLGKAWWSSILTSTQVNNKMKWYKSGEKRAAILLDKSHKFEKIWSPCIKCYLPKDFDRS